MDLIPWRNKRRETGSQGEVEHPLAAFRSEIDSVFDRFFRDPWGTGLTSMFPRTTGLMPRLDLAESDNDLTVRAELPGVNPDDVRIEVSGNMLTLSGEKSAEKDEKQGDYHYSERQFGRFSRTVQLPTSVDPDKVDATYNDGVLTITLAKHPEAKPKRITVRNA